MGEMVFTLSDVVMVAGLALQTGIVLQRLKVLEKKQDLHNSVVERMAKAESRLDICEERQKVANHRIEDLEENK